MNRRKLIALGFAFIGAAISAKAAPQRMKNTARAEKDAEFDAVKDKIQDALNPASVDSISNFADLKAFLKDQQKVIKVVIRVLYKNVS